VDAPYARLEQVEPGIARVLAHNPSAFTYYGTQTYLVGTDELAVIDPGPDLDEHLEALVAAIGGRPVVAICCTHTHRDHSPGAKPLAERIGAPIIGCAPLALETAGPRADAAFDMDYAPNRALADGEIITVGGQPMTAVATPGHTSNHLCFAYGDALLTGPREVRLQADGRVLTADHVLIAVGARPKLIPGFSPVPGRIVTSRKALEERSRPDAVAIIGGGAHGCEGSPAGLGYPKAGLGQGSAVVSSKSWIRLKF